MNLIPNQKMQTYPMTERELTTKDYLSYSKANRSKHVLYSHLVYFNQM